MIRLYALILLGILYSSTAWATHNRAGEITYKQIGPNTIEATIVTYTKISGQSIHADRDQLTIHWGDGISETVLRSNGLNNQGVILPNTNNDIKRNEYVATHTYPGPSPDGTPYVMWMQDVNRNDNILNINNGQSVNIPFYVQTEVYLLPPGVYGRNSSPILLEPPIDFGVVGQVFQHTPNGYDPDGDSVAYELITPLQETGLVVPSYRPVSNIGAGGGNQFTFDDRTGLFTWTTPQVEGEYNIAILVKSYRNGQYLGGILRDIQIEIRASNNTPPIIETIDEICVVAGDTIDFEVLARDIDDLEPDSGIPGIPPGDGIPEQIVTLTGTGGVFQLPNSPATFAGGQGNPIASRFVWETNCTHIQTQAYQIVFKAKDNYQQPLSGGGRRDLALSSFKVVRITVIAPPPEDLQVEARNGVVTLDWAAPYACEDWAGFLGFSVWRKQGCDDFTPDSCDVGLNGRGYTQLADGVLTLENGRYVYRDSTATRGVLYSYRILGNFGTPVFNNGTLVNIHSFGPSRTSNEQCVRLGQDIPLITNVDIGPSATSATAGEVFVQWSKPQADELDTLQNPPPYRYEIYRSDDLAANNLSATPVFTATANTFFNAVDTSFTDVPLDTETKPYSYVLRFFSAGNDLGATASASSIRLNIIATDAQNILRWEAQVPWTNLRYVVFQEAPTGTGFTVLDTVSTTSYIHRNLTNGQEYCYYIQSIGTYGTQKVLDPLYNRSQLACGTPLDTIPPCPPIGISSVTGCETADATTPASDLTNLIQWSNKTPDTCQNDVARFRIYFAPLCNGEYILLGESTSLNDTLFEHQPSPDNLAGCYYVTAIDSIESNGGGNESAPSEIVEVDNCPVYELPNVFTPNGDGRNDRFVPFKPYRYISRIDMKIFNRWGQVVFETTDPEIQWDGTDQQGKLLNEEAYFYTCIVHERRLNGDRQRILKGYIHLIHGEQGSN